ncbi:sufE-like protein 1, chloroplastic/mitochondrial [Salvia miltiorrhiza]|uniref:sufE-like protein 1, chloroplastic/mitochondrial n=1 Tax=Salvia miltiorrhiza TaxID=226208 RepID=UPI0025AB9F05|nr:sufE-like protein 1, chloroplastic/mitochondrial [Salvia miltiorrhiza]
MMSNFDFVEMSNKMKCISSSINSRLSILHQPSLSQKISLFNRKLMSIPTKIPISSLSAAPFLNPAKTPTPPHRFFFFSKNITFQRISTKQPVFSAPPSASSSVSLQPVEELPPKLQEIVKLFQAVEEPKAKYEQLLFYGRNLNPLESNYKTSENKVQGCVSQVWVRAYFDEDKNVIFEADSDSMLTKGLAALLVQGLSGRPVEEIVRVSPDFAMLLGLQQSLTPSRNNGFLNMLKLMQKKALQLYVEAERGASPSSDSSGIGDSTNGDSGNGGAVDSEIGSDLKEDLGRTSLLGSRGRRIEGILEKELRPTALNVEDISYQHAGHSGVAGSDGETHFNVEVVSEEFEGKSLVKRHRMIYSLLQDELQSGLHALSIVAKTPTEVDAQ